MIFFHHIGRILYSLKLLNVSTVETAKDYRLSKSIIWYFVSWYSVGQAWRPQAAAAAAVRHPPRNFKSCDVIAHRPSRRPTIDPATAAGRGDGVMWRRHDRGHPANSVGTATIPRRLDCSQSSGTLLRRRRRYSPVAQPVYRMAKRGGCACEVQTALTDSILAYTEWLCRVYRARGIRRLGFSNEANTPTRRTDRKNRFVLSSFIYYYYTYTIFSVNFLVVALRLFSTDHRRYKIIYKPRISK